MRIPQAPPPLSELMRSFMAEGDPLALAKRMDRLRTASPPGLTGRYRHWNTLRRIAPPEGFTVEELWLMTKLLRKASSKDVPSFRDAHGRPITYVVPDAAQRMLHRIDKDAAGQVGSSSEPITNPSTRNYYLISSLIEEAITSSQ